MHRYFLELHNQDSNVLLINYRGLQLRRLLLVFKEQILHYSWLTKLLINSVNKTSLIQFNADVLTTSVKAQ